jgi:hypothetical protein
MPKVSDFEERVTGCDCLVFVATSTEREVISLLQKMLPASEEDSASCWPVVVVAEETIMASSAVLRRVPHVVLGRSQIAQELVNAISQEAARATLSFLEWRLRSICSSSLLLSAALLALRAEGGVRTVRILASRMRLAPSTLHHHWNREELRERTGLTFRQFLDIVVLLRIRARLGPRLTLAAVAAEYGTTDKRVRETFRLRVGAWRHRDRGGWLALAAEPRSWGRATEAA